MKCRQVGKVPSSICALAFYGSGFTCQTLIRSVEHFKKIGIIIRCKKKLKLELSGGKLEWYQKFYIYRHTNVFQTKMDTNFTNTPLGPTGSSAKNARSRSVWSDHLESNYHYYQLIYMFHIQISWITLDISIGAPISDFGFRLIILLSTAKLIMDIINP